MKTEKKYKYDYEFYPDRDYGKCSDSIFQGTKSHLESQIDCFADRALLWEQGLIPEITTRNNRIHGLALVLHAIKQPEKHRIK